MLKELCECPRNSSQGNKEPINGNWKKGSPCYHDRKLGLNVFVAMWKVELVGNEFVYLVEGILKVLKI